MSTMDATLPALCEALPAAARRRVSACLVAHGLPAAIALARRLAASVAAGQSPDATRPPRRPR